jgi:hypothetical protein
MPKTNLWNRRVPEVELDQRARETRRALDGGSGLVQPVFRSPFSESLFRR